MLQQTQVDRVAPKFVEFTRQYPTARALAAAPIREVKRIWYPLGYNARPVRLHLTARETVEKYGGKLPDDPGALDDLPGIGRYTANAVASIAFGRRTAVVDTNVRRVLGRAVFGGRTVADRRIWDAAQAMIPADRPGDFNQAVMDLGAAMCRPRRPDCPRCPVRRGCRYPRKTRR
jgi:A/G-specific adenine glycosylase